MLQKLKNSVKRKATEDLNEKPSKIIHRALESQDLKITTKDVENIRLSMYRSRRAVLPRLPRNRSEVQEALNQLICNTRKNEGFLLSNDKITNIIIFSCETNIRYLCSQSIIYVDGTFSYCPKHFYQFFTIHSIENGHYIPLAFSLLPDKSSDSYAAVFDTIRKKSHQLALDFRPKRVVCDFEVAIHMGLKKVWPEVELVGCRFHLAQSWWRRIQQIGLSKAYKDKESDVAKWIGWTFGLPFLNAEEVSDCFVEDFMSAMPSSCENLRKYADYLVENYICEESAKFPPSMWASCTSSTERTTNACESFHARFNKNFYVPHPDIFKFLEVLKNFQIDTDIKINSVHLPVKIKNSKYKKRNEYITNIITAFTRHEIKRFEFVKCVSYYYNKNF